MTGEVQAGREVERDRALAYAALEARDGNRESPSGLRSLVAVPSVSVALSALSDMVLGFRLSLAALVPPKGLRSTSARALVPFVTPPIRRFFRCSGRLPARIDGPRASRCHRGDELAVDAHRFGVLPLRLRRGECRELPIALLDEGPIAHLGEPRTRGARCPGRERAGRPRARRERVRPRARASKHPPTEPRHAETARGTPLQLRAARGCGSLFSIGSPATCAPTARASGATARRSLSGP